MGWVQVGNIRGPKGDPGNDQGLVHGPVSGAMTLDASIEAHILSATGPTTITMGTPPFPGQVVSLIVTAGGKNVILNADAFPKGQPTLDDQDVVNFVAVDASTWWCFGTGAAVAPDTTPPSAPTVSVASFTDTTITLAVTRGVDAESTPTLMVRSYVSGAATKPDFAAMFPDANGQLVITGLSQLTTYVIEVQEVSKGGTSAVSSVTQKTAMTHGWVVADTVTFDGADGTALSSVTSSAGQTLTTQNSYAVIAGNQAAISTASQSSNVMLAATSNLPKARVSADYACPVSGGRNVIFRLGVTGSYPLGYIGFQIDGSGAVALDSGSNATWSALTPVAGASLTGQPTTGTMTVDYDQNAQNAQSGQASATVTLSINGSQVATSTVTSTPAAGPVTGARFNLNNYGGTTSTADNLTVSKFQ